MAMNSQLKYRSSKSNHKTKRNKSNPRYRSTRSENPKQAHKVNRSRLKYDKDKLDSSDIDEIPGLESLNKGDNYDILE